MISWYKELGFMFKVRSYIFVPENIPDPDILESKGIIVVPSLKEKAIEVTNTDLLKKLDPYLDHRYLEGYIELSYYDEPVLSEYYSDLIDQLWDYLLNLTLEAIEHKESTYYFPDQPVRMNLKILHKGFVLFSIEDKNWCLPKKEFFLALVQGCTEFYKQMILGLSKETVTRYAYDKGYEQAEEDRSVILDYLKKNV
jgi:hypothetical protein